MPATALPRAHLLTPLAALALSSPAWADPEPARGSIDPAGEAHAAVAPPPDSDPFESLARPEQKAPESAALAALERDLEALLEGRILGSSTTAVYIVDAFTGESIYERHIDEPLNPASNVKLVTTAAALDVLGPDWRYAMRVYGPLPRQGVVDGDLYLRGGADPTLDADDIASLAGKLAAAGVHRVRGDIVLGPYRVRDSVGVAPVEIKVVGDEAGEPPRVEVSPSSAFFEIENEAQTIRNGRARIRLSKRELSADDEGGERAVIRVRGSIREGRHTGRTYWIQNRAGFTAHAFLAGLEEAGVEIEGSVRRERFSEYAARAARADALPVELARHESAPMSEIAARVNKPSNNFLADRVAMTAGAKLHGGTLSMQSGLAAMDYWLLRAGLDPDAIVLDTGSGLSYETEFSARQVMGVMRAAAGYHGRRTPPLTEKGIRLASAGQTELSRQARDVHASLAPAAEDIHPVWMRGHDPGPASFLRSLPIAGVDGTLGRRFRHSAVRERMVGKTGTLRNIIALSGFLTDRDDNQLGFAIITNDHRPGLRTAVRDEQGRMVEVIHRYLERRRAERREDPTPGRGDEPTS